MKTLVSLVVAAAGLVGSAVGTIKSEDPKDSRPVPVIDVHTHVLNAHDLPLLGIFDAYHAGGAISFALANTFNRLTAEDNQPGKTSESAEMEPVEKSLAQPGTAEHTPSSDELRILREFASSDAQLAVEMAASKTPALKSTRDLLTKSLKPTAEEEPYSANEKILAAAFMTLAFDPDTIALPDKAVPNAGRVSADAALRFVRTLTRDRMNIAETLRRMYPQADLFVNHLMDLQRTYATKPQVDFAQQNLKAAAVDHQFAGRFAHFTAFDPFRGQAGLASVKEAVLAGALGVKLYPPSGFRPAGNTQVELDAVKPNLLLGSGAYTRWQSRYQTLGAEGLNQINHEFFTWAQANDVPLFVHCTPTGFEASSGYGLLFAHPKYWDVVFAEFPKLRVCFAHAGGESYWFRAIRPQTDPTEATRREFGAKVVALCRQYENVYCDFAYLEAALTDRGEVALEAALAEEFHQPGQYAFGTKVMYGSDWHMMEKVVSRDKYLETMNRLVSRIDGGKWQRNFLSGNAVRYLKLDQLSAAALQQDPRKQGWDKIVALAAAPEKPVSRNP